MHWIARRIRRRAIEAVLLGLAALQFAGATPSAASSYTFTFTGTVTTASGVFTALGITAGDAMSGSLTFDPFNDTNPVSSANTNYFIQSAASFTFHVSHPGVTDFTHSDTGNGYIANTGGALPTMTYVAAGAHSGSGYNFFFETQGPHDILTSLAALPTNPSALVAFLGSPAVFAYGGYNLSGFGDVGFNFTVDPVTAATTPIPAALPLFGSGLAVLGLFARKRRKDLRATA